MTDVHSYRPSSTVHMRSLPRVRRRSHSRSRMVNEQFSPPHRGGSRMNRDTSRVRRKEISMRLMKPTIVTIDLQLVMQLCRTWRSEYETDGAFSVDDDHRVGAGVVYVHDEGLAQYQLVDVEAHHIFYAAVALGKPSLRCSIVPDEPVDQLDQYGNTFAINQQPRDVEEQKLLDVLVAALQKKGYKFRA